MRWIRRCIVLLIAMQVLYATQKYGYVKIPAGLDSVSPYAAPGDGVILQKIGAQFHAGVYVLYQLREEAGRVPRVGRIFAAPGDVIRRSGTELHTPCGAIPLPEASAPFWLQSDSRTLQEDEFLICNSNLESRSPDGRSEGAIPLRHIVGRVVLVFR